MNPVACPYMRLYQFNFSLIVAFYRYDLLCLNLTFGILMLTGSRKIRQWLYIDNRTNPIEFRGHRPKVKVIFSLVD